MMTFWIISALLLLVAVLFVAIPLWRGSARNNAIVRDAANLAIYRDQMAEMDADLENGLLTPALHEEGRRELQARLLQEVQDVAASSPLPRSPYRILASVLLLLLPLATVGLYLAVGNPAALSPVTAHGGMTGSEALASLEERVADNPGDVEALLMLARTYADLGRFVDAAKNYERLTRIVSDEAWIWADYADALAMVHKTVSGIPARMLEKALALDPNNLKALALSGAAAMERGDYVAAVRYWEKLLKLAPQDNSDTQVIRDGLRVARQMLAQSKGGKAALDQINAAPPQAAGKASLSGTVSLSAALKNKAAPQDTLFVLARAVEGPRMPLAVLRKQVKDLPLQFELDDSMAMASGMRISDYDRIIVVARISKSGQAMPGPGDLQGTSQPVRPGSRNIRIEIDEEVR